MFFISHFCNFRDMRFILIPDKFKGSLTAKEVISSLSKGIRKVYPRAEIHSVIASDGGDGFLNAIENAIPVKAVICTAVDPLMREIRTRYLFSPENKTAYIELAECSGIVLLDPDERDPLQTTTLGTGMQLRHALENGARRVYIGLGGSATNDGGIGIAHGLGYRFLDSTGHELRPVGGNLGKISQINSHKVLKGLEHVEFYAVNDVLNPLLGEHGAAFVYAAQKGAGQKEIDALEAGMNHFVRVVDETFGKAKADLPGAGAAGGTAFGLHTFVRARFVKGVEFLLELTNTNSLFENRQTDLLITGEGAIDEQTLQGKLIHGVVGLGKRFNVPVVAICGKLDLPAEKAMDYGLEDILEIRDKTKPVSYSMENASALVEEKIRQFLLRRKREV